jgi:exodeoxyribonuclease VII large subunit
VTDNTTKLHAQTRLLETLSHRSTLERGFAMVIRAGKGLVTAARQVDPGDELQVTFADGTIDAVAAGTAGTAGKQRSKPKPPGQGDLF